MFQTDLSNDFLVSEDGTSEGTQDKYYKDGYWYKINHNGDEATAEVLSSVVLSCSSLTTKEYVIYEDGMINQARGCRSRDFLSPGENMFTLYRFYEQITGQKLNEAIHHINNPKDRVVYVLSFFRKYTNLDLTDYFRKIFTIDLFNLNEDRHFNNLAIIRQENGVYRPAPIFDNGNSLFIGNYSVNPRVSFEENRTRIIAKPFAAACEAQYSLFSKGFTVDFNECRGEMRKLNDHIQNSREFTVMMQRLDYLQEHHPELISESGLDSTAEAALPRAILKYTKKR